MSDFLLALQDVHVNFPARKNWLGKVTERVHHSAPPRPIRGSTHR
jgi:hypothetical protein